MQANLKAEALGNIAWWGFTPAVDLLASYIKYFDSRLPNQVNVLVVGGGDSRHILQTIANVAADSVVSATFFITDTCLESYARVMLQLYIALENEHRLNLQDKTETFLELFGNTLLRENVATYLRHVASEFIRIVTSFDSGDKNLPFIDLSNLKFKERDVLESIFKFWRKSDTKEFEVNKIWDYRLRKHLGTRYDAIPNVFDWDCSITLHDRKAEQIDSREYSRWRQCGVAFELRQADYIVPNRSLASGRSFKTPKGETSIYWGYWGDITTSPYITFGIRTDNHPELARQVNGKRVYGATTVAEVNLRDMLWRLEHHRECPKKIAAPFLNDRKDGKQSGDTEDTTEAENEGENVQLVNENHGESGGDISNMVSFESHLRETPYVPIQPSVPVTVKYLPVNSFPDLPTRYQSIILGENPHPLDIIYVGCGLAHLLDSAKLKPVHNSCFHEAALSDDTISPKERTSPHPKDRQLTENESCTGLTALISSKAILIVESVLYIVELRPAEIEAYVERVTKMASELGFQPSKKHEPMKDHHLIFVRNSDGNKISP
ncbi:hypothetical protein CRM22_011197 [Opisthorchis felineus]|uniref:Dynein assembly factor 3, axonemal n=1 Tax=Opisthorchis felineus TaxID=147828 RepID=A0A4S2KAT6_OPIFE|nr:hypothetical protein CRM22_011197 [Opisthorchis felineus]